MLICLAIRQILKIKNIILIIFIGFMVTLCTIEARQPPLRIGPVSSSPERVSGYATFTQSRDIGDYDVIIENGLFGSPNPVIPQPRIEWPKRKAEVPLQLRLLGTQVSNHDDPYAAAVIELENSGNKTEAFYLGQEIIDRVYLLAIRRKEVVLDDRKNSRHVTVTLERTQGRGQLRSETRLSRARTGSGSNTLSRAQTDD